MPPERKICWRVTRACNLSCLHCLAGHENSIIVDLSSSDRVEAARRVSQSGIQRITWTGGEPTICPDLPDLLQIMRDAGISNTITTHGLALRRKLLDAINLDTDRFRISLDGLENTHNHVRQANVFKRTIRELERVVKEGYRVEVNLSAIQLNHEELPELAKYLAERGVKSIVIIGLVSRESAIDNCIEGLIQSESDSLSHELAESLSNFPDTSLRYNDYAKKDDSYIILESDGDIVLSSEVSADMSFGNILDSDGKASLSLALEAQTLRHQQIF